MLVQIPETGVIKKQKFDIEKEVSIIYGYNNCGKTTFLKALDQVFCSRMMERFLMGEDGEIDIYIPTNRIVVSEYSTERLQLKDVEEFIHYQKDSYIDYSLHLKRLRDYLFTNDRVHHFISHVVHRIFEINLEKTDTRYSDGIENIINIYLNVIWAMTWDMELTDLTEERFRSLLAQKQIYVLIDEIEMFLHVNIQSKLIASLKEDFPKCRFILTTHSPLLLTRYKQCYIYTLKKGRLKKVEDDMYYEDLNIIYEQLFDVDELPAQARKDINFLVKVVMENDDSDTDKIVSVIKRMREEYPNLCRRYSAAITKAEYIGEKNDQNKKDKHA